MAARALENDSYLYLFLKKKKMKQNKTKTQEKKVNKINGPFYVS